MLYFLYISHFFLGQQLFVVLYQAKEELLTLFLTSILMWRYVMLWQWRDIDV